jgi:hypothetical protein
MRCKDMLYDEHGSHMVEKIAMIALMLVLLMAIGIAFQNGGSDVGWAFLDHLIKLLLGIIDTLTAPSPNQPIFPPAVPVPFLLTLELSNLVRSIAEGIDALLASLIGLAAGVISVGMFFSQNWRRAVLTSVLTIKHGLPRHVFLRITQEGASFSKWFRHLSRGAKWLGPIAIAVDIYDLGSSIHKDHKAGHGFGPETKKAIGRVGGGWSGAAVGALVGSWIMPGFGTIIGAVIGGIGGSLLGEWIGEQAAGDTQPAQEGAHP